MRPYFPMFLYLRARSVTISVFFFQTAWIIITSFLFFRCFHDLCSEKFCFLPFFSLSTSQAMYRQVLCFFSVFARSTSHAMHRQVFLFPPPPPPPGCFHGLLRKLCINEVFFSLLDIEFYSFPMISDFVEVVADCILCLFFFWGEFATGDAGA